MIIYHPVDNFNSYIKNSYMQRKNCWYLLCHKYTNHNHFQMLDRNLNDDKLLYLCLSTTTYCILSKKIRMMPLTRHSPNHYLKCSIRWECTLRSFYQIMSQQQLRYLKYHHISHEIF